MKRYSQLKMELVIFETADVITASGDGKYEYNPESIFGKPTIDWTW